MKYSHGVGLRFDALGVLRSKLVDNRPPFFKWGSVFFNFLIGAPLKPQITIRGHANISGIIFSGFWPLKIKMSGKKLYFHNPVGMLNHNGF